MSFGPIQLIVLGFTEDHLPASVITEINKLREHETIRFVDLLLVSKNHDGSVDIIETSDLDLGEKAELGAIAGALIGLGAGGEEGAEVGAELGAENALEGHSPLEDEVWYLADSIPVDTTAAIAVIEHHWAVGLRDAVVEAGGANLVDTWIHPEDLVELGESLA